MHVLKCDHCGQIGGSGRASMLETSEVGWSHVHSTKKWEPPLERGNVEMVHPRMAARIRAKGRQATPYEAGYDAGDTVSNGFFGISDNMSSFMTVSRDYCPKCTDRMLAALSSCETP